MIYLPVQLQDDTCRLALQLKQTIPTVTSVWLYFLKETKLEFFSPLLSGTSLDRSGD